MPEAPPIHTATSKTQYVYIGPPFNIGRLCYVGTEVPVALCEHAAAAPKKQYKLQVGGGLNLVGMVRKVFGK